MSVDLFAELPQPVTLAGVVGLARTSLAELPALASPPALVRDPAAVVARTRLTSPSPDLATACERYVRQFPRLNGWPAGRGQRSSR